MAAACLALAAFLVFHTEDPIRLALPMNNTAPPASKFQDAIWPASAGWPAAPYLAVKYGAKHGLLKNVRSAHRNAGKGAVSSLFTGANDVAYAFAPPIVEAASRHRDLLVLAVVMRSKGQVRMFVRAENRQDWYAKRMAVKFGTITDSLVYAQLRHMGKLDVLKNGTLTLVDIDFPENLFFALVNGEVEGASFPGAYAELLTHQQQSKPKPEFVDAAAPDVYPTATFLVSRAGIYAAHTEGIIDVLRVFREYGKYVAAHPVTELMQMHKLEAAGIPPSQDAPSDLIWGPNDFLILTDKDEIRKLLVFEAQLRIDGGAMKSMPDFEPALSRLDDITHRLELR
ncbi:MAG: hypothetical protein ACK5JT_20655 [Hyphomicrobiaceae bacterium]